MNVLVTGNSGLLGLALARRFGAMSDVRVRLFRTPEAPRDIRSRQDLRQALKGIDAVFHLAGLLNYRGASPEDLRAVNVEGTRQLLDEALAAGVADVVVASSQDVYAASDGRPGPLREDTPLCARDAYGRSKQEADEVCQRHLDGRLRLAILRIAAVYGPESLNRDNVVARFLGDARREGVIRVHGQGRRIRDIVWVEDVAGALLAFQSKTGVFNVGGGHPYTAREIAETVREAVGGRIEYDGSQEEETGFFLDISKARAAIGYQPAGFGTGLQRSLAVHV